MEKLRSRGLEIPDRERASRFLETVGYYRASAYAYPFRELLKHYVEKYDSQLPIWVATEIMEFGQLVRLLGFMTDADQSRVATDIGSVSGAVFVRWMKVANYLRNVSAHHARLWNRSLTYKIGRVPDNASRLRHLNDDPSRRSRVYGICAILAYLSSAIRAEDGWTARLVELLDRFPSGLPVTPEAHMGFPTRWRQLELWADSAPAE